MRQSGRGESNQTNDRNDMVTLHHYPLCPHSRFVRLVLSEMQIGFALTEEKPWEREKRFLELDPSGETPVLVDGALVVPGAEIAAEYLDETRGMGPGGLRLMPADPVARLAVRRISNWFHRRFFREVSEGIVAEKVMKRFMRAEQGGGPPDMSVVRAARQNLRYHLAYLEWLLAGRTWLMGESLTNADLAAAAHLSCVDYLGDVPWSETTTAKAWYARMKARPAFAPLLADRLPGMAPAAHYAEAEF